MTWTQYVDQTGAPETIGPDGGDVVIDEEHGYGARITLEQNTPFAPFAITCGIYEWMVHTRFCKSLDAARRDFAAMKVELSTILEAIPMRDDPERERKMAVVADAMSSFVDRYP